jgi:spermidine synthase
MSFFQILAKYSGENNTEGTDKATIHSYGEVYNTIIENLKTKQDVKVLEIGIYSGAFLQVLCECLPSASVVGIDIDLSHLRFRDPAVTIHTMDGTSRETVARLGEMYDLVIDDGSHRPADQLKTLDIFAPCIKPGGVFVMEDIQPQYADALKAQMQDVANMHDLSMEWMDLRHVKNRYDDIIAVFTRVL